MFWDLSVSKILVGRYGEPISLICRETKPQKSHKSRAFSNPKSVKARTFLKIIYNCKTPYLCVDWTIMIETDWFALTPSILKKMQYKPIMYIRSKNYLCKFCATLCSFHCLLVNSVVFTFTVFKFLWKTENFTMKTKELKWTLFRYWAGLRLSS